MANTQKAVHRLVDAILDIVDLTTATGPTLATLAGVVDDAPAPAPTRADDAPARRSIGARKALNEVLHAFGPCKPADAIRQVLVANPDLAVDQIRRAFHAAKRDHLTSDDGGI